MTKLRNVIIDGLVWVTAKIDNNGKQIPLYPVGKPGERLKGGGINANPNWRSANA